MLVNASNLSGIFTGLKAVFRQTLGQAPNQFEKIGTVVPATGSATKLPLVGLTGSVREWVGERQVQNLAAYMQQVTHLKFEQTVAVKREDIEDDNIGLYKPETQQMAVLAKNHPYKLAITRIMTDGFTVNGIDNVPLFSETHKWEGAYEVSQDNYTDEILDQAAVDTGIEKMRSFKAPDGEPLDVNPTHFVCGPDLEATVKDLFLTEKTTGGMSNRLYRRFKPENIIIDARVPAGRWAMLDCSKPVKPVIFLQRVWPPEFVARYKSDDEHVFMLDEYVYGTRFRGEVVALSWWLVYGSDGSGS